MPKVQYAVPFVPVVRGGDEATQAAKQLTEAIAKWSAEGWTFVRLETLSSIRPGGCLSGSATVANFQLAILERDAPAEPDQRASS
jgi:hypothetical protein